MLCETSASRTTVASTSIGASAAPAPQPADRRERQNDGRNSEANPQEAHRSAAAEIRSVAKSDPVAAGDGVVSLMERIWPAFQGIDTSSKALGAAVLRTMNELIPILTVVSADHATRGKWLERLFEAGQSDGVEYLAPLEDRWGLIAQYPDLIE